MRRLCRADRMKGWQLAYFQSIESACKLEENETYLLNVNDPAYCRSLWSLATVDNRNDRRDSYNGGGAEAIFEKWSECSRVYLWFVQFPNLFRIIHYLCELRLRFFGRLLQVWKDFYLREICEICTSRELFTSLWGHQLWAVIDQIWYSPTYRWPLTDKKRSSAEKNTVVMCASYPHSRSLSILIPPLFYLNVLWYAAWFGRSPFTFSFP